MLQKIQRVGDTCDRHTERRDATGISYPKTVIQNRWRQYNMAKDKKVVKNVVKNVVKSEKKIEIKPKSGNVKGDPCCEVSFDR